MRNVHNETSIRLDVCGQTIILRDTQFNNLYFSYLMRHPDNYSTWSPYYSIDNWSDQAGSTFDDCVITTFKNILRTSITQIEHDQATA